MAVRAMKEAEFESLVGQNQVVVLAFGASWCEPCHAFERICEELSAAHPEVLFAKMDVDEATTLVADFAVRSVPYVMIMRQRTVLYAKAGQLERDELAHMLHLALAMKGEKLNDETAG